MALRRARLIEEFEAQRPKWLSLDVFDTVLFRPFPRATDVFHEVHRALHAQGGVAIDRHSFTELRRRAEQDARKGHPSSEITIDELCRELARTAGASVDELIAAEVATEQRFIQLDPDIAALIRHAHAAGVPYVLVSDMYLRAEHIRALLDAAMANDPLPSPEHIFVSGERRTNKGSGMFDEVIRELGCAPQDILHIGDHEHSDFASPKKRGVRALHYHRDTGYANEVYALEEAYLGQPSHPYDVGLRTIRSKALTSLQDTADEPLTHQQYGAFVLGPLLTLFAEWIVDDCIATGQSVVYCLMREGHLLAPLIATAAAARGVELTVHKLWVSRYAIRAASYHHCSEPELRAYFVKRHQLPLAVNAGDLSIDEERLRARTGILHRQRLEQDEVERVITAILEDDVLRASVVEASAAKRKRLFEYFASEGVFDRDRLTLVDLGWGGTIQATLAHAFRDLPRPRHVRGLYLATHEKLLELPLITCSADSFLYHLGEPRAACDVLRRSPELLEHSCMPAVGSFEGIDESGAVRNFHQSIPETQLQQIDQMQQGILHFAALWLPRARDRRNGLSHQQWHETLDRLRAVLTRSIDSPLLSEVRLFADWQHDNNDGSAETEALLGPPELHERARFMAYEQIALLTWHECFWPQALAVLSNKNRNGTSRFWRAALRYPAVRTGATFVSRSAAAVTRALGRDRDG